MESEEKRTQGVVPVLTPFPGLDHVPAVFDLQHLTASDVMKIITIALARTAGADGPATMRAQLVMEEQYARGRRSGIEEGRRDGYGVGYAEGFEEGRREALDKQAAEEAERATLKAAARARRNP